MDNPADVKFFICKRSDTLLLKYITRAPDLHLDHRLFLFVNPYLCVSKYICSLGTMKITPIEVSLALVVHSIDRYVIPETKSSIALEHVQLIRLVIKDILKRQGLGKDLLISLVQEGESLESKAYKLLRIPYQGRDPIELDSATLDSLSERHSELTASFDELCDTLSNSTHSLSEERDKMMHEMSEWEFRYYKEIKIMGHSSFEADRDPALPWADSMSKESLRRFLAASRGPVQVVSLNRAVGGVSKQTYFATLRHGDGSSEEIVVRKADASPLVSLKRFNIDEEFHILRSLNKTGFPCPQPLELGTNVNGFDGPFFTMKRLPGSMLSPLLKGDGAIIGEEVWVRLAELLAKLHSTPLEAFSDFLAMYGEGHIRHSTTEECYRRDLKSWTSYLNSRDGLPSPTIKWLLTWLQRNIPKDSRRPVLVHGDFNVHNILVQDGAVTGILDWETAAFGAPEQDLAYMQPLVSKHYDFIRFIEHYRSFGGQAVDESTFPFYLAYALMQPGIGFSHISHSLLTGRNMDIRFTMAEQGYMAHFLEGVLGCIAERRST